MSIFGQSTNALISQSRRKRPTATIKPVGGINTGPSNPGMDVGGGSGNPQVSQNISQPPNQKPLSNPGMGLKNPVQAGAPGNRIPSPPLNPGMDVGGGSGNPIPPGVNTGPLGNNPILTAGPSQIGSSPTEGLLPQKINPRQPLSNPGAGPGVINPGDPQWPGVNTGPTPVQDNNPIPMGLRSPQQQQPPNPFNNPTNTNPVLSPSPGVSTGPTNTPPPNALDFRGNVARPESDKFGIYPRAGESENDWLGRVYDFNLQGGQAVPGEREAMIAGHGIISPQDQARFHPYVDPNIAYNNNLMQRLNAMADQNERGSGLGAGTWGAQGRAGWIQQAYDQQKNRARG